MRTLAAAPALLLGASLACSSAVEEQGSGLSASVSGASASATDTDADTDTTTATTDADTSTSGSTGAPPTPGVDLALAAIVASPMSPETGDPVTLTFTVKNLGDSPLVTPVRLGVAIAGVPTPTLDGELAALGAGASVDLVAPAPWLPAAPGEVEVAAVIDADAALDEADEANNYTAITVSVGGGAASPCRTIDAWSASAPFTDDAHVSHPLPSFASQGWYYVHTQSPGGGDRILYSAKPGADGALSPWQVASSDHGGGPHGFTAIDVDGEPFHFRNGHIARFKMNDGIMEGDVELVEDNVDTAFGGNKYVWDAAVFAALGGGERYVVHLGGFSFTGYTYKPDVYRSPLPVAPAFTDAGLDHPNTRPGKSVFHAPEGATHGYIFTGEGGGARLWRGQVAADGAVSGWDPLADLPPGTDNERGDLFVGGRTLFAVRGAKVFRADIAASGALSPWEEVAGLPEPQIDINWGDGHLEGAAFGVLGDFAYVTGPKRVYHGRLEAAACAN